MIEIIKGSDDVHDHRLVVDGVVMIEASVVYFPDQARFSVAISDHTTITSLISKHIAEVPNRTTLGLTMSVKWSNEFHMFLISKSFEEGIPIFTFRFTYRMEEEWDRPYSFQLFKDYVEENLNKSTRQRVDGELSYAKSDYIYEIHFYDNDLNEIIANRMNIYFQFIRNAFENADTFLRFTYRLRHTPFDSEEVDSEHSDHISMTFDFPEEVRVPCEQYLIYFAQFLHDLGVSATSDIRHEAGQVLFTVTPTDPEEALDNIRLALEMYVSLPSNPNSSLVGFNDEIGAQRLAANVDHLNGQLRLMRAELQAKDTTIEAQQIIIQQQRVLNGDIILDSIKNVTPKQKDEDREELFGGKVSLVKYKGKFFDLDVPTIFRELKRLFSKKD